MEVRPARDLACRRRLLDGISKTDCEYQLGERVTVVHPLMNLASKAKAPDFECPEIGWTQQECNEATAKRSRETPNRVRQHFSCTTSCLLAGLGRRLFEDLDEAAPFLAYSLIDKSFIRQGVLP